MTTISNNRKKKKKKKKRLTPPIPDKRKKSKTVKRTIKGRPPLAPKSKNAVGRGEPTTNKQQTNR